MFILGRIEEIDWDALYGRDEDETDVDMKSHGSVITHLLSQVCILIRGRYIYPKVETIPQLPFEIGNFSLNFFKPYHNNAINYNPFLLRFSSKAISIPIYLFYTMILFFNFEKSAHFEKCSLILLHSCNIKNLKLFPKSPIFPNYSPA